MPEEGSWQEIMVPEDRQIDVELLERLCPVLERVRGYHGHEVHGLDYIPKEGGAIIATNHSLATYDIALLYHAIFRHSGRIPRALADHLFFKIPLLGEMVTAIGAQDGTPENARRLLLDGLLIGVAPGGMREALRPSSERYQILWGQRKGFIRLSVETGAPIILAICPKADDLYEVYQSPVTSWAYRRFRIPLFFARGLGFSPLPRKVRLTHFLSEPVYPPKRKEDPVAFRRQVDCFHQKVLQRTQTLIGEAIAYRQQEPQAPEGQKF